MNVAVIFAALGETMNQSGITVEVEMDWLVDGEQAVEVPVGQT